MTDILNEVLLDQNDEKKVRFLKLLLPITVICAIVAAILIFAYNWQQNKYKANQIRLGNILVKSIIDVNETTQTSDVNALDYIIQKNERKISELAELKQVAVKIYAKDDLEAKKLLEKIINNANYDKVTLSFARIAWLGIMIDKENLSDQEKEQLENFLYYFKNEKQPFFGIGSIFKALWYIKHNQNTIAQDTLKIVISTKSISANIKELAQIILSNLSYKGDI